MKVNSIGQTTTPQTFKTRSNTPQEPTKPMYRGLEQDTVSFSGKMFDILPTGEMVEHIPTVAEKTRDVLRGLGQLRVEDRKTVIDELLKEVENLEEVGKRNGKVINGKFCEYNQLLGEKIDRLTGPKQKKVAFKKPVNTHEQLTGPKQEKVAFKKPVTKRDQL